MRRTPASLCSTLITIFLLAPSALRAESPTPETRVESAVADLNAWLGDTDNSDRWRRYLLAEQLEAELARGDSANRETIEAVLARFQSQKPGLSLDRFRAVEQALVAWHATLQPQPANLAQAARDAAGQFTAVGPQDVAQAKAELAAAMSDLEGSLNRSGATNAAKWKTYLGWNDLAALVQSNDPPAPAAVAALTSRYEANQVGLELPRFIRVRTALETYADVAAAAANPMLQAEYAAQLEGLATNLEGYAGDPAAGDAALQIGRTLDWLARRRQASNLVTSIRRAYSQPNFYGYTSERFAKIGFDENVDQVAPVRDYILGTSIYGTAHMRGRTSFAFAENPNAAAFHILLGGQAVSNNVGYNRGVTLYTTGVTNITGSKYIQMTDIGLNGLPAIACCDTNTNINSICARCRLVERIAWKRAGKQQSQAEAIASDHAEVRVANQINQRAAGMIAEQNQKYYEKFRNPLVRRGELPEELRFSSTTDRGEVRMLKASGGRIGAPTAPPPQQGTHDLALRAHESVVVNFGEAVMGGYYLSDLRLEKLLRDDLKTEVPEELRVTLPDGTLDLDKEPWAIEFARELPVRAKFSGGKLAMAIRAQAFYRGQDDPDAKYNKALDELIEISATYSIEKAGDGATLRREGDVVVDFPEAKEGEQSARRVGASAFLKVKFRNLFKEEFVGEGLKFKGRFENAGTLRLQEIASDAAWLSLGWQLPTAGAPTPAPEPEPAPAAVPPPAASGGGQ